MLHFGFQLERIGNRRRDLRADQFAKALARGQKDRWDIIKTVVEDKVREVV